MRITLVHPKRSDNRRTKRPEGGRLVYYAASADVAFWEQHWRPSITPKLYHRAATGYLGVFEKAVIEHLPKEGRIIEAGCGTGIYVLALARRGYNIQGVDWAYKTVRAAKALLPELLLHVGDVRRLDVGDSQCSGYMSLGVIEHFDDAEAAQILAEAYRVLKPGGRLILSTPYYNPLRYIKAALGLYRAADVEGLAFFQYAFSAQEVAEKLERAGFRPLSKQAEAPLKCLREEVPLVEWLLRVRFVGHRLGRLLERMSLVKACSGHILIVAAEKPA